MSLALDAVDKQQRVRRTLRLVRTGHGLFTTSYGRRITGWPERSLQRYLTELQDAGLIRWTYGKSTPQRWTITQAGVDELSGVT